MLLGSVLFVSPKYLEDERRLGPTRLGCHESGIFDEEDGENKIKKKKWMNYWRGGDGRYKKNRI